MLTRAATHIAPPLAVIVLVITTWWLVVVQTESVIFPTPWQVAAGAFEQIGRASCRERVWNCV